MADLEDPSTLAAANEGVDEVVLQLPLQYDLALHETYGRNAVDAARAEGVRLVIFNTSAHVLEGTDVHVYQARQEVVSYLRECGIPNIVLRRTFYMEIFLGPWIRPGIVEHGIVTFPLPADFRMSWVSADELAAYAVAALDRPGLAGAVFDIGGPQALTGDDVARCFSEALDRPMAYAPIPPDDYERALVPMFGATVASEVAGQVRCIIARGDGTVEMTETAAQFSVVPAPLAESIKRHDWDTQP